MTQKDWGATPSSDDKLQIGPGFYTWEDLEKIKEVWLKSPSAEAFENLSKEIGKPISFVVK